MRIRKRQVPFPLSPAPLSDPHLTNRSPVVVQLNDAAPTPNSSCTAPVLPQHDSAAAPSPFDRHQPPDHTLPPIGKPNDGWDDSSGEGSGGHRRQRNKQDPNLDEDGRGEGGGQKGNDTRKGSIFGSEISPAEVFPQSNPSNQDWRWCEGQKAIPLKKRRGSFENVTENNTTINNNNNKKIKTRMKTKMNKKCTGQNDNIEGEDEDDDEQEVGETKPDVNVGKKRARGSALMEGSRCSRVNGRGWRCCQQTLVGYSLCEHHLGKGRLRSMTSVRSRSIASGTSTAPKKLHDMSADSLAGASSSSPEKQAGCVTDPSGNDGEDMDEKKPLIITKKKMKLGMVKARSMSSLLGQTNTEVSVVENNK